MAAASTTAAAATVAAAATAASAAAAAAAATASEAPASAAVAFSSASFASYSGSYLISFGSWKYHGSSSISSVMPSSRLYSSVISTRRRSAAAPWSSRSRIVPNIQTSSPKSPSSVARISGASGRWATWHPNEDDCAPIACALPAYVKPLSTRATAVKRRRSSPAGKSMAGKCLGEYENVVTAVTCALPLALFEMSRFLPSTSRRSFFAASQCFEFGPPPGASKRSCADAHGHDG